ncbi:MAG TPA: hypothetical protein DCL41_07615 [Bdellovibrionales bacterium]|nr:hypothetical protein [Pseudobdellovibrionaceae bacterium]HAG91723.1 hypothetical protein [Bdellovibrionales bacterium]
MYLGSQESEKQKDKKQSRIMLALATLLIVSFLQITQWDKYAFEVIPLQARIMTGAADGEDFLRMSAICFDRKKYDCSIQNSRAYLQTHPEDLKARYELGLLELRMNHIEEGAESLRAYIDQGGEEPRAHFELGKAYAKLEKNREARKEFSILLNGKTDVFHVSVTRAYVNTLINEHRWVAAKRMIEQARKKSLSYNAFMTAEYRVVMKNLSDRGLASQ